MRPKVSILIPAKNEEKVIGRLLASIQKVDYPKEKLEVFVIVDGSTDRTADIARSFKGVKVLEQKEPRKCKGEALNAALPLTKGEIIAVFDADGIVSPNAIKAAVAHFKKKEILAVTGPHISQKSKNLISKGCEIEMSMHNLAQKIANKMGFDAHINGGNFYVRKEVLEKIGGFEIETLVEDSALAFALKAKKQKNPKIILEPKAIVYQQNPHTISAFIGQRSRWSRGLIKLIKKYSSVSAPSIWLSSILEGVHFYAAPFSVALTFGLFMLPLLSKAELIILTPIATIILAYIVFAMISLARERKIKDAVYIPIWLGLSALEFFIFCKAIIDEALNKEFTWFKTPRF
ncbi:MAG: glycosyltransferase [Candidatus Nanoarchaeia archaeon]